MDTITEEEREVVEELKRRTIQDCPPKMLVDPSVFYRFCKARDFNLNNAEEMLRKQLAWRIEYQIDNIITEFKPPELLVEYTPVTFLGFDKDGDAVKYIDFGRIDAKGFVNSFKQIDIIKYNLQLTEQDFEILRQHSKKIGKQVNKITYIYNLEDLTLATATYKKGIDLLIIAAKMFQNNYPEIIKNFFYINGSVYFTLLYSIVKKFFAPALQAKVQVFSTEGFQETLLSRIDAEVLPAFLGGTRTDPDGNPNCYTIINYGREIPLHHYRPKSQHLLSTSKGVTKLTVGRFSKSDIEFDVPDPGSVLEWEFETKCRDIGFGLYFRKKVPGSNPVELVPLKRVDTYMEPENGAYECRETGIYFIVFDNSYSWLHPKDIFYKARIVKPKDVENMA